MDENTDIAFLAASVEREMRNSLAGSSGLSYNKTDFRKFLDPRNSNNAPQMSHSYSPPQHFRESYPPQYPPQQYPHPQFNPNNVPVDPDIPDGILQPSNAKLVGLPQHYLNRQPELVQQNQNTIENIDSFTIPDYSAKQKQYLEDEQLFRDALIKEVKAQKKALNKLNRQVETLILTVNNLVSTLGTQSISKTEPLTTQEKPDDNSDQS